MKKEYEFSNKAKRGRIVNGETKVQKTFRIDLDVLLWLNEQAEKEGLGYQTFLNSFLKKSMSGGEDISKRLEHLEKEIVNIKSKLKTAKKIKAA